MKLALVAFGGAILIWAAGKYVLHITPEQIGQGIGLYLIPFALIAMRKLKQN